MGLYYIWFCTFFWTQKPYMLDFCFPSDDSYVILFATENCWIREKNCNFVEHRSTEILLLIMTFGLAIE